MKKVLAKDKLWFFYQTLLQILKRKCERAILVTNIPQENREF